MAPGAESRFRSIDVVNLNVPPLARSILDVIGHTPLVELTHSVEPQGLSGRLLAKLEFLNPGGSKKDRIALEIIREARASGELHPGQTVVELTSGNTGTGLAIVCRAMGNPFVALICAVIRSSGCARWRPLARRSSSSIRPREPSRARFPARTWRSWKRGPARSWPGAGLSASISSAAKGTSWPTSGTRGRNSGPNRRVRSTSSWTWSERAVRSLALPACCASSSPSSRAYVVEPAGVAVLSGGAPVNPRHRIQGAGYGRTDLELFDRSLATGYVAVTDEQAIAAARHLAAQEGIFAGFSTGAHLAAAWKLLAGQEAGSTIAFLACDSGLKYLSTDLFP